MKSRKFLYALALLPLILTGCGDSTSSESTDSTTSYSDITTGDSSSIDNINSSDINSSDDVSSKDSSSSASEDSSSSASEDSSSSSSEDSSSSSEDSSSSSSEEETSMSAESAINLLTNLADNEKSVSKEYRTETNQTNNYEKLVSETLSVHSEVKSSSSGSVITMESGVQTSSESFAKVSEIRNEKVMSNAGNSVGVDFLYQVSDYETSNDEAGFSYVFDTDAEAASMGLEEGDYLLTSDAEKALTMQASTTLAQFIASNVINNAYASQVGASEFDIEESEDGSISYSLSFHYSISGDLDDTMTYSYDIQFVVDSEKLISYSTVYSLDDVRTDDPDDAYSTVSRDTVTLEYGEREAEPESILEPTDYFLSSVDSIDIMDGSRKVVDASSIPTSASYLFAKPISYSPAKAVFDEFYFTPVSTSDSDVIEMSGSYFNVAGAGSSTITFEYLGRVDGVYQMLQVSKEVKVVEQVSSIWVSTATDLTQLTVGETYTIEVDVLPSTADQEYSIDVGDESILTASSNEDNDLVINALAAGSTTITLAAGGVTKVLNCVVAAAASQNEYFEFLCAHSFLYRSIYGFTNLISFKSDYTGQIVQTTSGTTYPADTFTFTMNGNYFTLTFDGTDYYDYVSCYVSKDFSCLIMETSDYATHKYYITD